MCFPVPARPTPMPDNAPLYHLSLVDAARLIARRELSPLELTRACLARIEALEPRLHAFITVTAAAALDAARRAETEIGQGAYRGPLHGIPIALKDIVATRGVRTTAHSRALLNWIPNEDAEVVVRLAQAGAICLGKTALHEFAYGSPGADEAFPAARHPWNTDYAPGSSSSGSGVAVAAGEVLAAVGTDTGGSIRHPASVCGVVAMKPTYGRVSVRGVTPLAPSLDHVGPMTRTVRDNALMLSAMAGYDARDPWSRNAPVDDFSQRIGRDLKGLRIGIARRFLATVPHSPEVLEIFETAVALLQTLGASIRDIDIPGYDRANDVSGVILAYEAWLVHHEKVAAAPDHFGATFRQRIAKGGQIAEADYQAAYVEAAQIRAACEAACASDIDLIASPGRERCADTMAEMLADPARRGLTNRMYNLTGMPALTLPMGFGAGDLPIGLQLAAGSLREDLIYQAAAAYEDAAGWVHRRPPIN